MPTTIDEIRTFKHRKGQGHRTKGSQGKTCSKCGMAHLPRECPAWGKKCHKCGNKNHFSMYCRSKTSGARNRKSCSTSRGCKGKGKPQHSRSRSKSVTKSAHSSQPPFRTIWMTSMEKVQTSMEIREKTSMEPTPFKTIRKVLILLKKHFLPFQGQSPWPA